VRLHQFLESPQVALGGKLDAAHGTPSSSVSVSGEYCISNSTREREWDSGWNVTTPLLPTPEVLRHAIRWSGICSVISASHSFSLPATVAFQCR